jgi:anti-sigma factor RsiW
MTNDDLEFSISQYLDGTLPPQEAAALEERLAEDSAARKLLEEYQSLDRFMKAGRGLPTVNWYHLGESISQSISSAAPNSVESEADVEPIGEDIDEKFEFALTQYLDGSLSPFEKPAVESQVAADPAARRILEDYRSLNTALRQFQPLPSINWDRLTSSISAAVNEQAEQERYSIRNWLQMPRRMAIAACLLTVTGLAIYFSDRGLLQHQGSGPVAVHEVLVVGNESPAGLAVAELSLTDEPESIAKSGIDEYSSGVVTLPARVQIAASIPVSEPMSDGVRFPF